MRGRLYYNKIDEYGNPIGSWEGYNGRRKQSRDKRTTESDLLGLNFEEDEVAKSKKGLRPALTIKQVTNGYLIYEGAKSMTPSEDEVSVFDDMEKMHEFIKEHFKKEKKNLVQHPDERTMVVIP